MTLRFVLVAGQLLGPARYAVAGHVGRAGEQADGDPRQRLGHERGGGQAPLHHAHGQVEPLAHQVDHAQGGVELHVHAWIARDELRHELPEHQRGEVGGCRDAQRAMGLARGAEQRAR